MIAAWRRRGGNGVLSKPAALPSQAAVPNRAAISRRWREACRSEAFRDAAMALIVATAFCMPMLLRRGAFVNDWENHMYLVAKQASYVREHLGPTFFLNSVEQGWFYPFYAFYGGTLYYTVALAAVALGSVWVAYVGSYVLAAFAAFAGWTWLARQAGLARWDAYLPGLVFVGATYYVTNAYGRGAWPEFVAVSTLPLVLAAAWHLLTCRAVTIRAVLAFLLPIVILTGSHTITLLYGSLFLVATFAVLLLIGLPISARPARLAALLGLAGLGLGINAWFLVPLVAYRETLRYSPKVGLAFAEFTKIENLFSLFPRLPFDEFSLAPQLYVQLPLIPLAATALVVAGAAPFVRRPRLLALAAAVVVGLVVMLFWMTDTLGRFSWWDRLPQMLQVIQFPYRLGSYVLLCAAGLMLVACLFAAHLRAAHPRVGGALLGLLAAATLVQVGFGLHQIWTARTYGPTTRVLVNLDRLPGAWYDKNYLNNSVPKLDAVQPERPWVKTLGPSFDADAVRLTYPRKLARREVKTNVVPSPLIEFEPAEAVRGQYQDFVVVRLPRASARTGNSFQITVRAARTPPVIAGTVATLACLAGAAGLLAYLARRGPGRRTVPFAPIPRFASILREEAR